MPKLTMPLVFASYRWLDSPATRHAVTDGAQLTYRDMVCQTLICLTDSTKADVLLKVRFMTDLYSMPDSMMLSVNI